MTESGSTNGFKHAYFEAMASYYDTKVTNDYGYTAPQVLAPILFTSMFNGATSNASKPKQTKVRARAEAKAASKAQPLSSADSKTESACVVLDLGCGTGLASVQLARQFENAAKPLPTFVGVDAAGEMVIQAAQHKI